MTASASKQGASETRDLPSAANAALTPELSDSAGQSQRQAMIAESAFFIAQERGFGPDQELDDWLAAEREVDQRLLGTNH